MFGLSDNTTQSNDDPAMLDNVKQLASEPADSVTPPAPDPVATQQPDPTFTPMGQQMSDNASAPAASTPPTNDDTSTPPAEHALESFSMDTMSTSQTNPATTMTDPQALSEDTSIDTPPADEPTTPSGDSSNASAWSVSTPAEPAASSSTNTDVPTSAPDQNHLAGLKQQALSHLEPLTEHLEGTPEEVFKTTMMMIQANDNHTLLEKALEAAKNISDDKERAQAMLDIVNEINYFSQNSQQ